MKEIKRSKGFTLIELIAVLVILAIISLIVTPLVLNIVRNAKDSANKRSVDAYGKSIELSIASYLLDNEEFPTSIKDLKIEYKGSEVACRVQQLNEDSSVYLSECKVGGKEVKDLSNEDGFYHYGKDESQYDYKIGDEVIYNGMNFYVIENSKKDSDSVTLLKAEPLTVDEVNRYGAGHVNRYTVHSVGTAYNNNGYGGMAYYTSETCGIVNGSMVETRCTTDYAQSEVKYVVDAWAKDKFKANDLRVDATGYSARLITLDELTTNLGYVVPAKDVTNLNLNSKTVPRFVYSSNYSYWTMSPFQDSNSIEWLVGINGSVSTHQVRLHSGDYHGGGVRPVIILQKSAL